MHKSFNRFVAASTLFFVCPIFNELVHLKKIAYRGRRSCFYDSTCVNKSVLKMSIIYVVYDYDSGVGLGWFDDDALYHCNSERCWHVYDTF